MTILPVVWHEAYEIDIGPHVFPTKKYRLVRDRLLRDKIVREQRVFRPEPATDEQVALVHTSDYVTKLKQGTFTGAELLRLEVPFTPAWVVDTIMPSRTTERAFV
jgi:acetoin utilization deacetylase AcuC-like enzyme